jgi:hypothetical protein
VRLEGLGKLEKSSSSGREPATFRLAAAILNLNFFLLFGL